MHDECVFDLLFPDSVCVSANRIAAKKGGAAAGGRSRDKTTAAARSLPACLPVCVSQYH